MSHGPFHPRFDDLPPVLPLFPLAGALLLPGGKLPLNIFEPRYLNMVLDCLGMGRMIGMIQPADPDPVPSRATSRTPMAPARLYSVGCAGRVSSFSEAEDGRLLITLSGVTRFRVRSERPLQRGYRMIEPDWDSYRGDLNGPGDLTLDRGRLMDGLAAFIQRHDLPLNLRLLDEIAEPALVTSLAMLCPFEVEEKQALLEAPDLQGLADMLLTLLDMARFPDGGPQGRLRQ